MSNSMEIPRLNADDPEAWKDAMTPWEAVGCTEEEYMAAAREAIELQEAQEQAKEVMEPEQ
jgi:hypothetical protein